MSERPLGEKLGKNLDPRAIDEVWERIEARRGRARLAPRLALLAGALALVLLFVLRGRAPHEAVAIRLATGELLPPSLEAAPSHDIVLDEGSRLSLSAGTKLLPIVNTGRALALTMGPGKATFDVTPNGPRTWTVEVGLATVTVLGTRFVVVREEHHVRVEVERGHVRVAGLRVPNGSVDLVAGQWVTIEDGAVVPVPASAPPPTGPMPSSSPAPSVAPSVSASSVAPSVSAPRAALSPEPEWHPLAKKGDYGAAYEALGKDGIARETKRATVASELLQVADVARLSGHPAQAVAPLERLLAEHAGDPSAPQAAFTLGKIQLDALGNARGAAAAFERAIALGLPGALREDAFFRRVEAYAKAGDTTSAHAARASYDAAFPEGRYRAKVAALAP